MSQQEDRPESQESTGEQSKPSSRRAFLRVAGLGAIGAGAGAAAAHHLTAKSRILSRIQEEVASESFSNSDVASHVHVKGTYTKPNGFVKEISYVKQVKDTGDTDPAPNPNPGTTTA